MKFNLLILALLALSLSACSVLPLDAGSTVSISLSLPAQGAKELGTKTIPANLDGMYLQALDGMKVVSNSFTAVSAGASQISVSMVVPQGVHTIHAFATLNNCIVGMAMIENVVVEAGKKQTLSMTMVDPLLSAITSYSYPNTAYADPYPYSMYFNELPSEFYPYFLSGEARLYAKRNNDYSSISPVVSWNDASESFPALSDDGDGFHLSSTIPGGVFSSDQAASVWFVIRWPGCPIVFALNPPDKADVLDFHIY